MSTLQVVVEKDGVFFFKGLLSEFQKKVNFLPREEAAYAVKVLQDADKRRSLLERDKKMYGWSMNWAWEISYTAEFYAGPTVTGNWYVFERGDEIEGFVSGPLQKEAAERLAANKTLQAVAAAKQKVENKGNVGRQC